MFEWVHRISITFFLYCLQGGACTSAMLKVLYAHHKAPDDDLSFQEVLLKMRDILKGQRFTQVRLMTGVTHQVSQSLFLALTLYPSCFLRFPSFRVLGQPTSNRSLKSFPMVSQELVGLS